jgi:general nucleoside transport system ATP-binding protein
VTVRSPAEARRLGISMVFQHFSLFDSLSVAENVQLGLERDVTLATTTSRIREIAGAYGLEIDPQRPVHSLSVGERQRVEIVRALMTAPKLLILDEPTSVLAPQAIERLFETLRRLARDGCSILFISHKLAEIRALASRCTVLRGGRVVGEVDPRTETNASLARMMIGAEPPPALAHARSRGAPVLQVERLNLPREIEFGAALRDISFEVCAGTVVGIAGISGNGQRELLMALSGEDRRSSANSIRLFGRDIARASPIARRSAGLHFVPEERLGRGAVPSLSLAENTLLTRTEAVAPSFWQMGWINTAQTRRLAGDLIAQFNVRAGGSRAAAKSLSGGNLQKFLVGREIDANPKLLILSQPTWGVDVGAAAQIHAEIARLRDQGCAVLIVSEELDELFELADELYVIAEGRLSPRVPIAEARIERIGEWMSGLWESGAVH